eukprot:85245-Rhodomonas_salina.1
MQLRSFDSTKPSVTQTSAQLVGLLLGFAPHFEAVARPRTGFCSVALSNSRTTRSMQIAGILFRSRATHSHLTSHHHPPPSSPPLQPDASWAAACYVSSAHRIADSTAYRVLDEEAGSGVRYVSTVVAAPVPEIALVADSSICNVSTSTA